MDIEAGALGSRQRVIIGRHGLGNEISKIFECREIGLFHSRVKPNTALPREQHKCVEIIYRIKGRSRMTIGEQVFEIGPGDFAVVPVGVWHQSTSLETAEDIEQIVLLAYDVLEGAFFNTFR